MTELNQALTDIRNIRRQVAPLAPLHHALPRAGLPHLLSFRSPERQDPSSRSICSGRRRANHLLSPAAFLGRASRLRPQLPPRRRIHSHSLLDQYRVGLQKPQARPPLARRLHDSLRLHIRAFARGSICPARRSRRQLRSYSSGNVHHSQCRLVWKRHTSTQLCHRISKCRDARLVA